MNSIDFSRRRAQFVRSRRSYIQPSLTSQDSLDSEEDWDASSESATSIRSTKSLRSFKSWKRSQREKRRNLKRVNSLHEYSVRDQSMEALDLSGDFGRPTGNSTATTGSGKDIVSHGEANEYDRTGVDIDKAQTNLLTTIAQSPVEAYYSSSPLTTSEDSDGPSTPRHLSANQISEFDETEDIRDSLIGLHKNRKDPLQRRPYPFIRRESGIQSTSDDHLKSPNSLTPPSFFFGSDRPRFLSAENSSGLNIVDSLDKTPSLLELAKQKSNSVIMEEQAENDEVFSPTREVLFAETNGFTVALPTTSPTVPAHILAEENEHSTQHPQNNENLNELKKINEHNSKHDPISDVNTNEHHERKLNKSWSNQASIEEIIERYQTSEDVDQSEQKAFQTGKGDYFLPPLIAKAIEKRSIMEERSLEAEENIEPKPETECVSDSDPVQDCPATTIKSPSPLSSTTQDATDDENVYLENADDIFKDLHETEFLLPPHRHALPESDTSSIDTRESVDPIEDILIREDDISADNRTFTLNGRAVINPAVGQLVKEDSVEVLGVEAAEAPVPENPAESLLIAENKTDLNKPEFEEDISTSFAVHSHKVGKDKKCEVCGTKSKKTNAKEEEITVKKAVEVDASKSNIKISVHSHRVGDDAGCEVCSSKDKTADISDISSGLCCCIL